MRIVSSSLVGALVVLTAACSSSSGDTTSGAEAAAPWDPSGSPAPAGVPAAGAQTPPTGGAAVRAWIQSGVYKAWHCESAPHASRSPSPHGMNRICANDLSSGFSADAGTGERPQGTAAVKEIYDMAGASIIGYAVYLKAAATSDMGANWYWYESDPALPATIHDSTGVVADGFGKTGAGPNGICVGCHAAAGSDGKHTPTPGSSDFVYTQVN